MHLGRSDVSQNSEGNEERNPPYHNVDQQSQFIHDDVCKLSTDLNGLETTRKPAMLYGPPIQVGEKQASEWLRNRGGVEHIDRGCGSCIILPRPFRPDSQWPGMLVVIRPLGGSALLFG
jgi:hypothetical protein